MDQDSREPQPSEFENWTPEEVSRFALGKTALYAPGGTGRWYFLSYAEAHRGYDRAEQFQDYSIRARDRIVEQVAMMCDDGVKTALVVAHMPMEQARSESYNQNMKSSYHLIADESAQALYERQALSVLFRGNWEAAAEHLGAATILEQFRELEQRTAGHDRRLIWLTPDHSAIPQSLAPLVTEAIRETGRIPDRAALCEAYYGFPISHVDIFLSNNKPSVRNMMAPLLTLGDMYFTVAPSLYMARRQWRQILYDHLFARRKHFRDYRQLPAEAMDDLKAFYSTHQDNVIGAGSFHELTQTWRPFLA